MAINKAGDSQGFSYIGRPEEFVIPFTGLYRLEVWGGGSTSQGGYSVGYRVFKRGEKIYICCGGGGQYGSAGHSGDYGNYARAGGYNGGGNGNQFNATSDDHTKNYGGGGSSGGGATHMAMVTGTLVQIGKTSFDTNGLLVAGGGGGSTNSIGAGFSTSAAGGTGGGTSGGSRQRTAGNHENGIEVNEWIGSGTNAFGQGGMYAGGGYYGGAGGGASGWWGGEGGSGNATGGGGGTGWIGGVPAVDFKGKLYSPSTSNGGNSGNGRASITFLANSFPTLYFGSPDTGVQVEELSFNGVPIDNIVFNGVDILIGASVVTYVYGNNTITENVDKGENAASKVVSIPGASFVGWTTTRGSTTPMTSIPATGEAMTLYAIYKYNDAAISHNAYNNMGSTWSGPVQTAVATGIDGTRYSKVRFYNVECDNDVGKWATSTWSTTYLGGVALRHVWWNTNLEHSQEDSGYPCYANARADIDVALANAPNQTIYASSNEYSYGSYVTIWNGATAIGRTVCS